jgi:OOP family OmpA-OmpF porin
MLNLKHLGVVAALGLLTGCAGWDIDDAREVQPGAGVTPFNQALTEDYRSLAVYEHDEMFDYGSSQHYAAKTRDAAAGDVVLPDDPTGYRREIPEQYISDMSAGRSELLSLLNTGGREKAPAEASRAQTQYDCWLEQTSEDIQPDEMAVCQAGFQQAMEDLRIALTPPPPAPVPSAAPESFTLYFAFDSAAISENAASVIDDAIAASQRDNLGDFAVTGHADRAGPEDYNLQLSLRRANAVRDALVARGISPSNISVAGRGEAEPAVPTPDGVPEQRNRRVEILLQ